MTNDRPRDSLLRRLFLIAALACVQAAADQPGEVTEAKAGDWEAVSLAGFADSINHAVMRYEHKEAPYRQYTAEQIVHIAENVLAGQHADGGWPKNKDWTRIYAPGERVELQSGASTFDNLATWSQIDYLARVHRQTGLTRYADAAVRGVEYILAEQRASGGWRGADVDAVTFNDDVMYGVLRTLKAMGEDRKLYAFADDALLGRVQAAYDKGLRCVLACQIRVGDRLTAWGQQHDHETLQPVWARAFEPPAIASAESVGVVRLLMSIDDPAPEIVASIEAAVAWFDRVKIEGLRLDRVDAEPVQYKYHWTDYDLVEVRHPEAPPIWTRYYDLETEAPLFCTRQRVITDQYTDLSRERRTGYSWYGYDPAELLGQDYPAWRGRWTPGRNVLK